ncbi:MAG: hypothetical protein LUD50_05910, partial [Clostridia bacterium]|nr:hypothetical protein [Clostridia bacterium]
MDFFQYANIADSFATFETRWLTYLVGGLCYAIVYIFLVVGLFIIAKREGLKHKWMIFIPILNTYYFGEASKKNKLFGVIDARIVAAVCSFLELSLVVFNVLYYVSFETLISSGYLTEQPYEDYYGTYYIYQLKGALPPELNWANWCYFTAPDIITWWLDIIYMVVELATFVLFFKTYAARRYLLFSITGVLFPIQGILVYTIKGNKGFNYNQFIKQQQQMQYQAYQQQMRNNPNGNPYNGGNPYSSNPYENPYSEQYRNPPAGGPDEDPFGGAGAPKKSAPDDDDPFAEFSSSYSG